MNFNEVKEALNADKTKKFKRKDWDGFGFISGSNFDDVHCTGGIADLWEDDKKAEDWYEYKPVLNDFEIRVLLDLVETANRFWIDEENTALVCSIVIKSITKLSISDKEFVQINIERYGVTSILQTPVFKAGYCFKGMVLNTPYSSEELCVW